MLTLGWLGAFQGKDEKQGSVRTIDVTYCRLTQDRDSFSGKLIRVRGIYWHSFEIERLESPECCPSTNLKIWVTTSRDLEGKSKRLFLNLEDHPGVALVVFVGKFESGGTYGRFGDRFQLTLEKVERIEARANPPSREQGPAWIPRCPPSK
jgi:hypothetical protein